jgi:hypothetical protein
MKGLVDEDGNVDERWKEFMKFQIERARFYFAVSGLCSTILCSTVHILLYWAILYCALLYCALLCSLRCTVLYSIVLTQL